MCGICSPGLTAGNCDIHEDNCYWGTHSGDMVIQYSADPTVLSSGTLPGTTRVTGYLSIYSNSLTTLGNGLPWLISVGEHLTIGPSDNLVTLGSAFPLLSDLGTDGGYVSLIVAGNAALTTLGTAFASLLRIPGTLLIEYNPLLTDWEALRNLECHGGAYLNDTARYCQGCPTWLLAKPQC